MVRQCERSAVAAAVDVDEASDQLSADPGHDPAEQPVVALGQ
jgi:hypothetical protein